MTYQNKYLKYKNKYLELKREMYGGLRVDNTGRSPVRNTLELPKSIEDMTVVDIRVCEGRCLVVNCMCDGYLSVGDKTISMMEESEITPGSTKYTPKIFGRKCTKCKHNLGSHALKRELNKNDKIINFISYKSWVEHIINETSLSDIMRVKLYDSNGNLINIKLGLEETPETLNIDDSKHEYLITNFKWDYKRQNVTKQKQPVDEVPPKELTPEEKQIASQQFRDFLRKEREREREKIAVV